MEYLKPNNSKEVAHVHFITALKVNLKPLQRRSNTPETYDTLGNIGYYRPRLLLSNATRSSPPT